MDKDLPFIHTAYANKNNLKEDNQLLKFLGINLNFQRNKNYCG